MLFSSNDGDQCAQASTWKVAAKQHYAYLYTLFLVLNDDMVYIRYYEALIMIPLFYVSQLSGWRQRLGILGTLFYVTVMIVLRYKVHALLMCRDVSVCALRRKYAHLFSQFAGDASVERPYLTQPLVTGS